MNIFKLAELELIREGKEVNTNLLIDRAITIRHWLDISERNKRVAKNRR